MDTGVSNSTVLSLRHVVVKPCLRNTLHHQSLKYFFCSTDWKFQFDGERSFIRGVKSEFIASKSDRKEFGSNYHVVDGEDRHWEVIKHSPSKSCRRLQVESLGDMKPPHSSLWHETSSLLPKITLCCFTIVCLSYQYLHFKALF